MSTGWGYIGPIGGGDGSSGGGGTPSDPLEYGGVSSTGNTIGKQKFAGETIQKGSPVSVMHDGRIVRSDANDPNRSLPIGIALDNFSEAGAVGAVLLFAPNAEGVLVGLGFSPGDTIYMSTNTGTYTNTDAFDFETDTVVQVGIADCPAGTFSNVATDLIMLASILNRP